MISVSASRRVGFADRLAVVVATALGCGYSPLAPGTVGSAFAVFLYLLLGGMRLRPLEMGPLIFATIALSGVGLWASSRAVDSFGEKDPGQIVIDEVAGQFVTFTVASYMGPLTPFIAAKSLALWLAGCFFFFRLFDVVKPFPVRKLESLPSGLGVMADDLLAGVYAGILVSLLWRLAPSLL